MKRIQRFDNLNLAQLLRTETIRFLPGGKNPKMNMS